MAELVAPTPISLPASDLLPSVQVSFNGRLISLMLGRDARKITIGACGGPADHPSVSILQLPLCSVRVDGDLLGTNFTLEYRGSQRTDEHQAEKTGMTPKSRGWPSKHLPPFHQFNPDCVAFTRAAPVLVA